MVQHAGHGQEAQVARPVETAAPAEATPTHPLVAQWLSETTPPAPTFKSGGPNLSGLSPTEMKDPLVQKWLKAQKDVFARDYGDNQKDADAAKSDADGIAMRHGHPTKKDRLADDKQDAAGDRQAGGQWKNGKFQPGDDQRNAARDAHLKALDQEMLAKYGKKLSPDVVAGIQAQMGHLDKTRLNSTGDIPKEKQYLAGDQSEQKWLQQGGAPLSNQRQIALRQMDLGAEPGYIADNVKVLHDVESILPSFGITEVAAPPKAKGT